ncbi:DUF547 domain-containing protein [uncultured Maribacter sp.]|uniref:DUF547 domain-containing protein n=1 Tax=uncultured Maribacter sp. TaxID=431308 RepID=UPI0030EC0AB8
MKRIIIRTLFFFMIVTNLSAQELTGFFNKTNSFLKTNVVDGRVKYAAIKENPNTLESILQSVKDVTVSKSDTEKYQAFWINAYNLLVIDGIVKNYPLKSPLDIPGFFDTIKHEIGGKNLSLNEIENIMLRAKFPTEARFHFVLVCAGLGCPPIINMAYTPEKINAQLQRQTVLALNNTDFIRVEGVSVKVSQIFEWYKGDFDKAGGIVTFINEFRDSKLLSNANISYYPYDWTLNSKK